MLARPATLLYAIASTLAACGGDADERAGGDTAAAPEAIVDAADASGDGAPDAGEEVALPPPSCEALGDPSLRLVQDGTLLRDRDGRQVWLRGVNAGGRAKFPPFFPFAFDEVDPSAPPFEEALASYYDRIAAWGHGAVRLPFTWEAVEPVRGTYDETFLARLDAMVDAAGARGIRVILDNHQDVFSRRYCGDGFPLWTMADPETPRPEDCSAWFLAYFQNAAMQRDFDRFWDGEDGLMQAFEAMWTMLATRYRDHDAVIGFEIINEPGWGTRDPNAFTAVVLTPFYTRMVEVIRRVSAEQLVFVDATGLDGVMAETRLERPVGDGIVFAPHWYDGLALAGGRTPDPEAVHEGLAKWAAVGRAWDVPVLIGEFGVPHELEGADLFIRAHWDAFDALGLHGTQWEYSVTGETWNAEELSVVESDGTERAIARELVRAYPAAIAGELRSWTYDAATAVGEIALLADGVTLVRAPARLYPGGPAVEMVEGEACARWDAATELLVIGARGRLVVRIAPEAR